MFDILPSIYYVLQNETAPQAGVPVRQPHAIVDYILQSGTKNFASVLPNLQKGPDSSGLSQKVQKHEMAYTSDLFF